MVITFLLWLIGLGGSAACIYLYFYEGIERNDTENKEREIYLIVGLGEFSKTFNKIAFFTKFAYRL